MDHGGHRHGHRADIRFPQAIYELIIKLILPSKVGIGCIGNGSVRILDGRSIGRISDSSQGEGRPLSNGIILQPRLGDRRNHRGMDSIINCF